MDVKIFEEYALNAVNEIFKNNDVAIMVGGTGLYIKAFAEGLDEIPEVDEAIRKKINEEYLAHGIGWLIDEIQLQDPLFFFQRRNAKPSKNAARPGSKTFYRKIDS